MFVWKKGRGAVSREGVTKRLSYGRRFSFSVLNPQLHWVFYKRVRMEVYDLRGIEPINVTVLGVMNLDEI